MEICSGYYIVKGKRKRTLCKNYKAVGMFSGMGKIYAGMLVNRVRQVNEGLIDDGHGVSDKGEGG